MYHERYRNYIHLKNKVIEDIYIQYLEARGVVVRQIFCRSGEPDLKSLKFLYFNWWKLVPSRYESVFSYEVYIFHDRNFLLKWLRINTDWCIIFISIHFLYLNNAFWSAWNDKNLQGRTCWKRNVCISLVVCMGTLTS